MKRKSTIIQSAVAAASAVGLSLAAPVLAKGDKPQEQEEGAQMEEGTDEGLEQQKVGGEDEHMKDKSAQKSAIDEKQVQKVFGSDVQIISIQDLPEDQVRKLQEELQALGLYTGGIDGKLGPQTRNALNGFVEKQTEINEQLLSTGQATTQLMDALGVSHGDVQPVKGEDKQKGEEKKQEEPQKQPQPAPQPEDDGAREPGGVEEPQY